MKWTQIFKGYCAAHSEVSDACDRAGDALVWWTMIPLVGWRRWSAYEKINRVREYLMEKVEYSYLLTHQEIYK